MNSPLPIAQKFKEEQRFRDRTALGVLAACIVGVLIMGVTALIQGRPFIGVPLGSLVLTGALGAVMWQLMSLRMKVSINKKRLKYEVGPLLKKKGKIKWNDVESCEIVQTSQLGQWSGGNLHFGDEAFVSLVGRNGLSITTKSGEQYFIGCNDLDELRAIFPREVSSGPKGESPPALRAG